MRILALLFLLAGCAKAPSPPPPLPYVTVVTPQVADVPLFYEYVGHVEPNQTAEIKPQASGILMGKFFEEGQEVVENSLLLTIDPRPYQAELDRAKGLLAQNLANLRQAQDTAQRYAKLVDEAFVSKLDYDRYLTDVATAEASVQQSYAEVEVAEINLGYCSIQAPFRGVASKLIKDVGNYVQVGTDDVLLTLNQISPIRVSFYVPEKDLPRITALQASKNLQTVVVINEECIEGDLFLINNAVDENTGTILLQSMFTNSDQKLWPGEFLDVRLILEIKKNALLLPSQAVQIGQDGPYVYLVKSDRTVELRKVKTGQKENDRIIIESGLTSQETVVLEGQLNLYPGAQVIIK
ncbi:MAG: efflux RND transporter periplasmic adaptor subunit [Verrucomicrobia bacterium]|nr:efflux RND transporter periplasmic adaptor subunit [Verrucomicrobiota bacterium]